jgi:hypothetical protein
MNVDFWDVFMLAFVAVAAGYALLASLSSVLYRRKALGRLTKHELKVKQGTATFENRMDLFVRTFFVSLFTYQVYLIALALGSSVYFILKYALQQ